MSYFIQITCFMLVLAISLEAQKNIAPPKAGAQRALPPKLLIRKQIALPPVQNPNIVAIPRFSAKKILIEEHIQLNDGDIFRGKFSQYIPSEGVHWKHPHISPKLVINREHIKHIQFKARNKSESRRPHSTKITLFSGDEFSGELQHMSQGKLFVNTWYGGQIEIQQTAIKSMIPSFTALKTIYEGPRNVKDWSFYDPSSGKTIKELAEGSKEEEIKSKEKQINLAHGTWKLKNGTFETSISQSRVGRRFKELPDRMRFDFDLNWSGYLNLYINFLSDRLDSYSTGNSYCLRLNTSYAYLYKYSLRNGIGGGRSMGSNVQVNLTSLGNNARISVRIDRKRNIIALFVNDKFLKKWKDTQNEDLPANAKGLLFTSMSSNLIELGNITVSEWSGNLPDGNKATTQNGTEDFILFSNEDSITGKLLAIKDDQIKFKTAYAELPIPLQTITLINMALNNNESTTKKGSVKAILNNGQGQISGSIQSWKDGKITLKSPFFKETSFNEKAFERIEFEN